MTETFTVIVRESGAPSIVHRNVSAIGIGHLRKDVVLVYADEARKPEEVGTAWSSITIRDRRKA